MDLPDLKEIEKQRKKQGLTQTALAKKAGVSQSLIARIEAGTVDPRYSKVRKVFYALQKTEKKEANAGKLMTAKVVGVCAEDRIKDVVKIMKSFQVSQVPVFKGKNIVGSITEKIILDEIAKGVDMKKFSQKRAEEHMDHPFPMVNKNTTLSSLSRLLDHNTAVLVMEKGEIAGIITNSNLLKVIRR